MTDEVKQKLAALCDAFYLEGNRSDEGIDELALAAMQLGIAVERERYKTAFIKTMLELGVTTGLIV